jgi:hypothetical protein
VAAATYARVRRLPLRLAGRRWAGPLALLGLFLGCFLLYAWAGPNQSDTDGWFPLANALLHGHFYIDNSRPWIELVPGGSGRYYLPFPPIPAVVLTPVVAILGQGFSDTSGVTALSGAANVLLVWAMLRGLGLATRATFVLTMAFAFGSEAFYVAATGGVHLWTETLAMTFILAALNLALRGSWPWLVGVLYGLAVGCRPTLLLTGPAFVVLYWQAGGWLSARGGTGDAGDEPAVGPAPAGSRSALRDRMAVWRSAARPALEDIIRRADAAAIASLMLGAILVGIWLALFNLYRFGSPLEFGYDLIRGPNGDSVLSEPWYSNGIVSPLYLPRGLFTMLLRGWDFNENFPWVEPNWAGCSIVFTTPIIVFLARARWRDPLVVAGWLGLVLPVGLDLMHGNPGFAQFGYRFILDGLPFAWLLLGIVVVRTGLTRGMVAAVVVGAAINAYGLACIAADFVT